MKTVRKIFPIDFFDIHGTEAWLEDMAGRGLRFTGFGPCFAHFVQGAPARARYHVEPWATVSSALANEQAAYSAQQGWEYVDRLGMYFHLYRADDPETPDFHTDPVVQSYTLDRTSKKLTRIAVLFCLMMLAECAFIVWSYFDSHFGTIHQLVEFGSVYLYFLVLMLLLFTIHFAWQVHGINRLRRQLQNGVPAPHGRGWRRTGLFRQGYTFLMNLAAIVSILTTIYAFTGGKWRGELTEITKPYPLLSLSELEGDPSYAPVAFYYPGYEGPDRDNYAVYDWTLLARHYEVDQQGAIAGNDTDYFLKMDWYDLTLSFLAAPLVEDLFHYHLYDLPYQPDRYEVKELTLPGFDRLIIASDIPYGGQELFAYAGDKVVYLNYKGGQDLADHLEQVARLLSWTPPGR